MRSGDRADTESRLMINAESSTYLFGGIERERTKNDFLQALDLDNIRTWMFQFPFLFNDVKNEP